MTRHVTEVAVSERRAARSVLILLQANSATFAHETGPLICGNDVGYVREIVRFQKVQRAL